VGAWGRAVKKNRISAIRIRGKEKGLAQLHLGAVVMQKNREESPHSVWKEKLLVLQCSSMKKNRSPMVDGRKTRTFFRGRKRGKRRSPTEKKHPGGNNIKRRKEKIVGRTPDRTGKNFFQYRERKKKRPCPCPRRVLRRTGKGGTTLSHQYARSRVHMSEQNRRGGGTGRRGKERDCLSESGGDRLVTS